MRLFFLRHGDAELKGFPNDDERALSPEGIAEIECVARAVRAMNISFNTIITSPLVRAKETGQIVAKAFPVIPVQRSDRLVPTSHPRDLFRELLPFPRDSRLLLVSHEPFISRCISTLTGGTGESGISIKKASLSCLEVGSPIDDGTGVLLWLVNTDQMKLMKK